MKDKELDYKRFVDVYIKELLQERCEYLESDKKEFNLDPDSCHDNDVIIKELQSILKLVDRFEKENWFN